jgi:methylmalonyl-CoA mutase
MEFESIAERGGVLGAMETMYQRGKIQDESLLYETRKHDGSLPIVGVNTFLNEGNAAGEHGAAPLFRATDEEQRAQVSAVHEFQRRNAAAAPEALQRLQAAAASGGNTFEELLESVRVCSLGQITRALYEVGGQYRRHM